MLVDVGTNGILLWSVTIMFSVLVYSISEAWAEEMWCVKNKDRQGKYYMNFIDWLIDCLCIIASEDRTNCKQCSKMWCT